MRSPTETLSTDPLVVYGKKAFEEFEFGALSELNKAIQLLRIVWQNF